MIYLLKSQNFWLNFLLKYIGPFKVIISQTY